nr:MAG TPA: hypothetical protein [Caudoviricetes sp.]
MSVKIYDASAGAFKDAPTPQIYDASAQAYKDSTGLVYDTSKGAWDERWGGKLWLYKDGDECRDVTGGWLLQKAIANSVCTFEKCIDSMQLSGTYKAGYHFGSAFVYTTKMIDFRKFSKIKALVNISLSGDINESSNEISNVCIGYGQETVDYSTFNKNIIFFKKSMKNESMMIEHDVSDEQGIVRPMLFLDPRGKSQNISNETKMLCYIKQVWLET